MARDWLRRVVALRRNDGTMSAAATAVTVIGGALGGGIVTALAGLIGAQVQSRREHSRWLRERRLEAYVALATAVEDLVFETLAQLHPATKERTKTPEQASAELLRTRSLVVAITSATSRSALVGPPEMTELARELQNVGLETFGDEAEPDELQRVFDRFLSEGQQLLAAGAPSRPRQPMTNATHRT